MAPRPTQESDNRCPRPAAGHPLTPGMDSETAALLRAWLRPLLEHAPSWAVLARKLEDKGYGLAFRHGRLVLIRREDGALICTARFAGLPLRDMAQRLGRPAVRPLPGRYAAGELLTEARSRRLAN